MQLIWVFWRSKRLTVALNKISSFVRNFFMITHCQGPEYLQDPYFFTFLNIFRVLHLLSNKTRYFIVDRDIQSILPKNQINRVQTARGDRVWNINFLQLHAHVVALRGWLWCRKFSHAILQTFLHKPAKEISKINGQKSLL